MSTAQLIRQNAQQPISIHERLRLLWSYVRRYPLALTVGICGMIGRDGVAFAIPLLIRSGINLVQASHGDCTRALALIGAEIVAVALLRAGFQTVARFNLIGASRNIEYEVRNDLLRHLFRLDAAFWGRTRSGDIMALATNDLNAVRMMLGPGLSSLLESLVALPVAFCVLYAVNAPLTRMALLPSPLAVLLLVCFGRIIRLRFDRIQAQFSTMSAAVQQTIAGARVVRSFVRENVETQRFAQMNRAYVRSNCALNAYSSSLDPLLSFINGACILIVLWQGGAQVLAQRMSVGDFVLFTTYMAMLMRPIANLGRVVNMMQRGMASTGRLARLFAEQPSIEPGPWLNGKSSDVAPMPNPAQIELRQVSVHYGQHHVLDKISLRIRGGETVAILGETGAGKSTLVKLLTRTIDPSAGQILFDRQDTRAIPLTALRSLIGIVPQETFLFSMTLAENIALGADNLSESKIHEAACIAGLEPDLEALPHGIQTIVGERGIMLSGGQKQRIAIARAVACNPRILILDDALSSVDSVTEGRILDHLKSIMAQRTTLLVTHRVATARRADHIVLLHKGRVQEEGNHEQLLRCQGHYARLARLQVLEDEIEVL